MEAGGVIEVDAVVPDVWVDGRYIEGEWSGFWFFSLTSGDSFWRFRNSVRPLVH